MHIRLDSTGRLARRAIILLACVTAIGCGDVLNFGGDDNSGRIKINGTIASVIVDSDTRDIVVFVYSDICQTPDADPVVCADLQLPDDLPFLTSSDYKSIRSDTVPANSNGNFLVLNSRNGDQTVVFLQDSETDPDGTIDPEDVTITRDGQGNIIPAADNAVSVLADRADLQDVSGGVVVELGDVNVDFPAAAADSMGPSTTLTTGTTGTSVTSVTSPTSTSSSTSVTN